MSDYKQEIRAYKVCKKITGETSADGKAKICAGKFNYSTKRCEKCGAGE